MKSKEDRNKKILAIVLVLAVIGLLAYKLFFEKKEDGNSIDTEKIVIVTNQNDFYTVSSCVDKFIGRVAVDDKKSMLKLLNEDYKKENSITENNIYSFITTINGIYSFNSRKMYVQNISKYKQKFYVYGYLQKETINGVEGKDPYYIVIILNRENTTFSVEPYDGDLFK